MDLTRVKLPPYQHQLVGIEALVKMDDPENGRVLQGCFALFDEMGVGKSKQVADAAQVLFHQGLIYRVVIIAPAPVRSVWFDQDLGELAKHLWDETPARIIEYHARVKEWSHGPMKVKPRLEFIITNFDFIRNIARRNKLKAFCGVHTWLVVDESSAVKNWKAQQTKAVLDIRKRCGRVTLLNGTPIANNPLDMYAQGMIMNKGILDCPTYTHFKAKYSIPGGFLNRQIIGWQNLEDLQNRFKPYVLRRLKEHCLDLPPKMPPVTISCRLTPENWAIYKDMRDELVSWLSSSTASVAVQAIVKILRLAQITSGFLGGLVPMDIQDAPEDEDIRPDWIPTLPDFQPVEEDSITNLGLPFVATREIGTEKLDTFLDWFRDRMADDPAYKVLVWCRFRPELFRLERVLLERWPGVEVGAIVGGQSRDRWKQISGERVRTKEGDRDRALRLLDPRTTPKGAVVVVGTPSTGSMGLNLTAAHNVVNLSYDYNLKTYLQSQDRVHRPGQTKAVSYYDIEASGPNGQKTIDHHILKIRRGKEDLAMMTASAWIKVLVEE